MVQLVVIDRADSFIESTVSLKKKSLAAIIRFASRGWFMIYDKRLHAADRTPGRTPTVKPFKKQLILMFSYIQTSLFSRTSPTLFSWFTTTASSSTPSQAQLISMAAKDIVEVS